MPYSKKRYTLQVLALMTVYIALMVLAFPHAHRVHRPWLAIVLALAPVAPVVAMVWVLARRIIDSDELAQRLHLIALSVATGIIATLSLAIGFLCAAGVLMLKGDILIWVFPILCVTYGLTRLWVGIRYGGGVDCDWL
ncbi:MAG: hypothetical protein WBW61_09105 [Rhodanobacteraceae bacterium]